MSEKRLPYHGIENIPDWNLYFKISPSPLLVEKQTINPLQTT